MSHATTLARAVVTVLVQNGVRHLVLCPGSRNAPLAFAAESAAQAGLLELHTRFDERTAGFLALGLSKVGATAGVITTSGTAVANLTPAVWEAAHAGVPLVALTADRPANLRGTNANQTTDQVSLFGHGVLTHDLTKPHDLDDVEIVLARCLGRAPQGAPVHLNVQLDEPLMPPDVWQMPAIDLRSVPPKSVPAPTELPLGPRTVVVAGDDAKQAARRLAEAADWPLFAEPTSGSRAGAHALQCYQLLLDGSLGQQIERAVVFGHPTLSRSVTRLLNRVEVISVPAPGWWSKRPFPSALEAERPVVSQADDPVWLDQWRLADQAAIRHVHGVLAAHGEFTPHHAVAAVGRAIPRDGMLFVGASSPIRDLDLMLPPRVVGERRLMIANRGLSGIDGTVSSAIGAALGRVDTSHTFGLLGDLTFLHDSNGLFLGLLERRPDLTLVVINDNGGAIFSLLEQGRVEYADSYERLFGLPHRVDLSAVCAAAQVPHLKVNSLLALEQALAMPNGGIEVIEVVVRRDNRRLLAQQLRDFTWAPTESDEV
jgi:2-succinyl-5-enolpyruvyl-6-hydroxy-3-cyclohexene-1-carboxylate synthase